MNGRRGERIYTQRNRSESSGMLMSQVLGPFQPLMLIIGTEIQWLVGSEYQLNNKCVSVALSSLYMQCADPRRVCSEAFKQIISPLSLCA